MTTCDHVSVAGRGRRVRTAELERERTGDHLRVEVPLAGPRRPEHRRPGVDPRSGRPPHRGRTGSTAGARTRPGHRSGSTSSAASARNSTAASAYGPPPRADAPPRVVAAASWERYGGLPITRSNVPARSASHADDERVVADRMNVDRHDSTRRHVSGSMSMPTAVASPPWRRLTASTAAVRKRPSPHAGSRIRTAASLACGDERLVDDRLDDRVDEMLRGVPGAAPLAFARRRPPSRKARTGRAAVYSPGRGRSLAVHCFPHVEYDVASRHLSFDRDAWAELRAATPLTLRQPELDRLRGINERIDLDEVAAVYLPLSRLLNLYVSATQNLHKVTATFLGAGAPKVPVRHRHRRIGRRRQEHVRPHPPGAARPVAGPSEGRSDHDRRVPPPEPSARRARHHAPQGLPGVVRHPRTAAGPA